MSLIHQLKHLNRQQVSNYFLREATKSCPENLKLKWMNQYIQNGGTLPNKDDLNSSPNIPSILRENRTEVMRRYSIQASKTHKIAEKTLNWIESKKTDPGIAIDLGGGNSSLALGLLQKKWMVIVVDPSEQALDLLQRRAQLEGLGSIAKTNLILIPQKMEDFSFPNNVDFIYAQASLPYCDAAKVISVWDKIHHSLKDGGYFAANLFNSCSHRDPISNSDSELALILDDDTPAPAKEIVSRVKLGAWMTSPSVAYSLLKNSLYSIDYFSMDSTSIEFIGRKDTYQSFQSFTNEMLSVSSLRR